MSVKVINQHPCWNSWQWIESMWKEWTSLITPSNENYTLKDRIMVISLSYYILQILKSAGDDSIMILPNFKTL